MDINIWRSINMEENEVKEGQKFSYEQLEAIARQLSEQNNQLIAKIKELQMGNMFKRIDYLFKILENAHMFGEAFVTNCSKEIEEFMTIPNKELPEEESDIENKE